MAHLGVGKLLEEFNIDEAADYYLLPPGKQGVFLSRLYSELEGHAREGLGLLEQDRGLKLHFVVEADGQGGFRNLPDDVFFRKICFYASQTVVTFPFRETQRSPLAVVRHGYATQTKRDKEVVTFGKYRTARDGYGGRVEEVRKGHHLYRSELDTFLHLLCSARPFLDSQDRRGTKTKFLTIVPSYTPEARKIRVGSRSALGLHPANFKLPALRQQFEEKGIEAVDIVGTPVLYLPYFSRLSPEDVLRIRQEERDRYIGFQNLLVELLHGLPEEKGEAVLLKRMEAIDKRLRELHEHIAAIEKEARQQNLHFLGPLFTKVAAIGIGFVHPPAWIQAALAAITGKLGQDDLTFFKFLDEKRALTAKKSEAVGNAEVYLHWRLEDPRHHGKLPPPPSLARDAART